MYESFFGLREPPFTLTPNPAFLYLTERSEEALGRLLYGIERREGFAVVFGDVGTGKTTLCWALMEKLEQRRVHTALIQKPLLSDIDILRSVLQDLGVQPAPGTKVPADSMDSSWMANLSKIELIERLDAFLLERTQEGRFTVVIIDEAQNLSMEALEQLRLLSNLETAQAKLLQFIFVGQLELQKKLEKRAMRQLNQRISFRFMTRPLSRSEAKDYISHRLHVAGVNPRLSFEPGALRAICRYSKGYPRLINLICDRALYTAFLERSLIITARTVRAGYLNIREPYGRTMPVWFRRTIPAAGLLGLALLVVFFLNTLKAPQAQHDEVSESRPLAPVSAPATPVDSLREINARAADTPRTELASRPGPKPEAEQAKAPPSPPAPAAENKRAVPDEGTKPTAANPAPDSAPKEGFFLQVASFRNRDSANAQSEDLASDGFPCFVRLDRAGVHGDWFGVYIGPYDDLAAARQVAADLRAAKSLSPILRRSKFE